MRQKSVLFNRSKWQFLIAIIGLLFFFQGCQKTDVKTEEKKESFETLFFKLSPNANDETKRIIETLRNQNAKNGFINEIPHNWGLPIWEKSLSQLHAENSNNLIGDSTENIIIPLTLDNVKLSAVLVAKETDGGYQIYFYTTTYLFDITHDVSYPTSDAEEKLAMFFYLENYAFGKKDFANIPPSLFRPGTPVDSFGNKEISIRNVDTSQLGKSSYICVAVICTICWGMDPNCPYSYEVCSYEPSGGNSGGGGGPVGGSGGGGGGSAPPPPPPPCQGQSQARNWYEKNPDGTPPCTPVPPPAPYFTIEDFDQTEVATPCIQNIIQELGQTGCNSYLLKLYQQANSAPANKKIKIKFKENANLVNDAGTPISGHTDIVSLPNNVKQIIISINPSILQNASQEFIGAVILHELTHGFLLLSNSGSTISNQHNTMFHAQVNAISLSLHELFPNLDAGDALSMALQGMEDVEFLPNTNPLVVDPLSNSYAMQHYGLDLVTARTTGLQFFNGMLGTACP